MKLSNYFYFWAGNTSHSTTVTTYIPHSARHFVIRKVLYTSHVRNLSFFRRVGIAHHLKVMVMVGIAHPTTDKNAIYAREEYNPPYALHRVLYVYFQCLAYDGYLTIINYQELSVLILDNYSLLGIIFEYPQVTSRLAECGI